MRGFIAGGKVFGRMLTLVACATSSCALYGQVFTVSPQKIEGHYLDFHPTNIALPIEPLTTRNRQDLLRFLTAEQGFAMRPLPIANMTLRANGNMEPAGSNYVDVLHEKGTSAKPGDRVVITDVKIREDKIVLDLNGGPERKHKFLRHISVGSSPSYTTPVVQDNGPDPVGSRITLVFPHTVPEVTGSQVEELLGPLLEFGVKSPVQAYTDTLPPMLKQAILEHRVLVGMSTDMVLYAKGQPERKVRETEGQMPFEEWIYGDPPKDVEFVRVNGNRVIRVEVAKVGESPVIRAQNEMGDYWSTQPNPNQRDVKLGDQTASASEDQTAPKAPPTLRLPGEKLPSDNDKDHPVMGPVNFPKDQQKDQQKVQPLPPPPAPAQGGPTVQWLSSSL